MTAVASEAETARNEAIKELHLAIEALWCGEVTSAQSHAQCAIGWTWEIQ